MSLPQGIHSRPPLVAPPPAVAGRILRLLFWILLFVAPMLLQVSFQVRGIKWQYRCQELGAQIDSQRLRRRHLLSERARLSTPARLRDEARALRLGPAEPGRGPVLLARSRKGGTGRD